jgi:phosphate transport system substrate-binding protein
MRRQLPTLLIAGCLAAQAGAQTHGTLPAYEPKQQVSGTIRSWGNDRMQAVMTRWEDGFRRYHPGVRFETKLMGTGTAIAGLYTDVADLALMGRPVNSTETMAFEWVFRYKAFGVQVSTGSLAVPGKSYAPVVFVHRDNPLSRLTLTELDAVFGCEHRRGSKNIRTWGDLGLAGEWAARPIHVYGPDIQEATGSFFREVVLKNSYKWNCDMKEFSDLPKPDGSSYDGLQQILDTLATDRDGVALSALGVANRQVKPLALSQEDAGPYYAPTVENVQSRKYPLSRATWIFVNRAPDRPLDPKIGEFLRYVLSREGQQEVARAGDYLPLPADVVLEQLRQVR